MSFEPSLTESLTEVEERHWFYQGRRDLLAALCEEWIPSRSLVTLDLGSSTGSNLHVLQERSSLVVGIELSMRALQISSGRHAVPHCQADATRLPLLDESIDLVVGLDLLEHLPEDLEGITEALRVLKPGGFLIFFTPAYPCLWSEMDRVAMHHRRYTAKSLSTLLTEAGLRPTKLSYWNTLLLPLLVLYRLIQPALPEPDQRHGLRELIIPPDWLNALLIKILSLETRLLKSFSLPFGGSVIAVTQKPPHLLSEALI